MARKPTGKPNGRPPAQIDWNVFEGLCQVMCTKEEICGVLKVDENTLNAHVKEKYGDTFSVVLKRLSDGTKASLRRTQIVQAKTNPTMAIWCGKQYLGQTDKQMAMSGSHDDAEFCDQFFGFNKKKK